MPTAVFFLIALYFVYLLAIYKLLLGHQKKQSAPEPLFVRKQRTIFLALVMMIFISFHFIFPNQFPLLIDQINEYDRLLSGSGIKNFQLWDQQENCLMSASTQTRLFRHLVRNIESRNQFPSFIHVLPNLNKADLTGMDLRTLFFFIRELRTYIGETSFMKIVQLPVSSDLKDQIAPFVAGFNKYDPLSPQQKLLLESLYSAFEESKTDTAKQQKAITDCLSDPVLWSGTENYFLENPNFLACDLKSFLRDENFLVVEGSLCLLERLHSKIKNNIDFSEDFLRLLEHPVFSVQVQTLATLCRYYSKKNEIPTKILNTLFALFQNENLLIRTFCQTLLHSKQIEPRVYLLRKSIAIGILTLLGIFLGRKFLWLFLKRRDS